MDGWLDILRSHLSQAEPSLGEIFETYAAEAKFGRSFIEADLKQLQVGACILEVGAGSMILSCQLASEGYEITSLEPIGEGFSHFSQLRLIVLDQASKLGHCPKLISIPAEEITDKSKYDFAFSINVMEHVKNVELVIERVVTSLRPMSNYHFTCPNYLFPYEPHFNIPTLLNKQLTGYFLRSYIFGNQKIPDPIGTWHSLNWITVLQISRKVSRHPCMSVCFKKSMLEETLLRVATDYEFASRRSVWIKSLINVLVRTKAYKLTLYIPAWLQPIIDCKITKLHKFTE